MLSYGELIGSISMGIFVGFAFMKIFHRLNNFTVKMFSGLIGVIFGLVVIKFLEGSTSSNYLWGYPLGLIIGLAIYIIIAWFKSDDFENKVLGRGGQQKRKK